jgi:hypothetical protein
LLAGCATTAPVPADTAELHTAIEHGQAALAIERAARTGEAKAREAHEAASREQSSRLKANLVSADKALEDGRLALGHGEVRIADSRLPDVTPDPEEMRAAEERRSLDAEAKVEQLQQNIAAAMGAAMSEAAQVARLEQEAAHAKSEASKARDESLEAQAELSRLADELSQRVNSAVELEKAAARKEQVATANRIGGFAALMALLAGVSIPWTRKLGGMLAGSLMLCSAGFFAYARFLGHPLFGWVAGGAAAVCVTLALRHLWLTQARAREADKTEMVASTVIDVLDVVYDTADAEHQEWMNSEVFDRLSDVGKQYRAAVHEIKASIKLAESLDKPE